MDDLAGLIGDVDTVAQIQLLALDNARSGHAERERRCSLFRGFITAQLYAFFVIKDVIVPEVKKETRHLWHNARGGLNFLRCSILVDGEQQLAATERR